MSTNADHNHNTTHNADFPSAPPEAHQRAEGGKPPKKLGSSPSLAMACQLIEEFYCAERGRVRLTGVPGDDATKVWRVFVGDKLMDSVQVVKARGRFIFQAKGVRADAGAEGN